FGSRTSSTRGEPAKRGGAAFGVTASEGGALATCLDGVVALGLGRTVVPGGGRPRPPWSVAALGGPGVSLGAVVASGVATAARWLILGTRGLFGEGGQLRQGGSLIGRERRLARAARGR